MIIVSALASVAAVDQAFASEQLDPGWDDPFFANYLKEQASTELAPPVNQPARPGGTVEFSLPVLGFPPGGAPGEITALAAPLRNRLATAIPSWPQCAKDIPDTTTVPNRPDQTAGLPLGSWYSTTYDFGCVQVVVEGNRNTPDATLVPDKLPIPESGDITISYLDENAGVELDVDGTSVPVEKRSQKPLGPVLIGYTRGALTYDITVSCMPESQALCANSGDLRALVAQLVPVAGRQGP